MRLTGDFETANWDDADLKELGAWAYAEHPATHILCFCWVVDGVEGYWIPGHNDHVLGPLGWLVVDWDLIFEAHNAGFEQAIWHVHMVGKYKMPPIPVSRWDCTMARSYYRGLPGALDLGAKVLGLAEEKDTEGRKITLGLSKPMTMAGWVERRPVDRITTKTWRSRFVKGMYDRTPTTLTRVASYCMQDCRTEVALGNAVGPLSAYERPIWELDQTINQRGLLIDQEYVSKCIKIVEDAALPLRREFTALTAQGNSPGLEPGQVKMLKIWCNENGLKIDNLQKETLKSIGIGEDEDEDFGEEIAGNTRDALVSVPTVVRRVLEIRSVLGSASIQKLYRMRSCTSADGRIRGVIQYHGAGTGRWAGRLFQPQNFPRGKIEGGHDPEQLVAALSTGDYRFVEAVYGDPIAAVASGLRHAMVAGSGRAFTVGDFAGIEARVVLALAGQHDKTALMAAGQDVYFDLAEEIYGVPKGTWNCHDKAQLKLNQKTFLVERQSGKCGVLGCGFQCGWDNFNKKFLGGLDEDKAKKIVNTYRLSWAPRVPKLWEALEEAALRAVWDKAAYQAYGVTYKHEGRWLTCYLPDGQIMWYFNPQPCRRAMPWDETDIRDGWTYQAMKTGRWTTIAAYGGLLTENVVQKLARGLLCEAMLRLERENFPLVLTVHDECMSEVAEARADRKLYEEIMSDPTNLSRALQVPIAVEGWSGKRYKK